MEYLERKITVFEPSYVKPLYVVQNSNMREIRISITDWDIPSGADVYWQVATSTKGEINVADVDGNTIYIRPYTSTFGEAGKGYLQVRVEHDGRVLISFSVDVYIQPDRVSNPTEGSNSDVIRVLVEQYVDDVNKTIFADIEERVNSLIDSIPADYTEFQKTAYNAYLSESASGKSITFENGADDVPLKSLVLNIEPLQDGEPSPTDAKEITGHTNAIVTRVTDSKEYNIVFPNSAGTVYGGVLDVMAGELVVDRAMITVSSSSEVAKGGATNVGEFIVRNPSPWGDTSGNLYGKKNIMCSHAPSLSVGSEEQAFTRLGGGQPRIVFPKSMNISSLEAFETWLSGLSEPLQFVYRIAHPVTYKLGGTNVTSLLGDNEFSSENDMEMEYRKDIAMVYSDLFIKSADIEEVLRG